jgi:hypothetical protein
LIFFLSKTSKTIVGNGGTEGMKKQEKKRKDGDMVIK